VLESVAAISREDLAGFHRLYHPAATTIAIVGAIEPAAVVDLRGMGTPLKLSFN